MAGQRILVALMAIVLACAAQVRAQITMWPERVETPSGLLTIYEPQPDKFDGNMLTARAAVSFTPTGQTDPQFGAMWFHARVWTDRDSHQVSIQNIEVKQVKLPNASPDQDKQFGDVIQQQVPAMNLVLSLDQLEATLGVAQKAKEEALQLQNTPPKIIFTQTPTTLVVLDGPPKLQDSGTAGVMTVVNTPFIMLFDLNSKTYFLKAGTVWASATDITGSWSQVNAIPQGVADAGAKLSAAPAQQPAAGAQPVPAMPGNILVTEEPTEVISTNGAPTYIPIPPGDLLYMTNTQSDVFMDIASQHLFVLLSGRWFSAPAAQGPWEYVASDKLPTAFAKIPVDSPKANVLVSVAGTQQAKDAKYDAWIPQTTAIQRSSGSTLTVAYDGNPQFVPIEGTQMTYAQNCAVPVVDVDNQYFCCSQGVWFQSTSPNGPWAVSTVVPPAIYTMPPSCPIYYCRYCYVYDSTPDTVYCGYLPGYTGNYVYGPTVVYGTGYNYPSWYSTQYYAPPCTWGFGAQYDYYSGCWGFGVGFYYNTNWFANRPFHNRWWGPAGYVGFHDLREIHERGGFDHIRPEEHNAVVDRINIYNREANLKRNAERVANRVAGISAAHEGGVRPEPARAFPPAENNVYAGHDGAVYRRTETGWESHDGKGWTPMKTVPEAEEHKVESAREPEKRVEPTHVEPTHVEPTHVEPTHVEPTHVEPTHPEPVHVEPAHVDRPAEQPARVEPSRGLEEEHAARERGVQQQQPQQHAPANNGGGGGGGGNPNRR